MNPGKPSKPASLKLLQGNPGGHQSVAELKKQAAEEPKPEVLSDIPEPPRELCPEAREEWDRICAELVHTRRLTAGMMSWLATVCSTHAHVMMMEKIGAPPNAALLGQIRLMYEGFGLTPQSMHKTKSINGKDKESPLAKYIRRA
jgi:hypothetical protein